MTLRSTSPQAPKVVSRVVLMPAMVALRLPLSTPCSWMPCRVVNRRVAVGVLARQIVDGEVLFRAEPAARNAAPDHEHEVLAGAGRGAVLARVAVVLLIGAVKLEQGLAGLAEMVGGGRQLVADGPAKLFTRFFLDFNWCTLDRFH